MSIIDDRRLIEDYLPIQAISAEASREKSVRKGHISTLHLWWARRPLVACRAAVYGALVPASQFVPNAGSDGKKKSLGRANAAKFIERLCQYPGSPQVIAEAQGHILQAHAERLTRETGNSVTIEDIIAGRAPRPKVLDMFAGGGAIPLEALRLGCEAYALELNPVAHIIELCTLVYPQKYGKADPSARGMTGAKSLQGETTWGGLAEEVRYWGNWVLQTVKAEIGDLYPPIPDPEAKPEEIGGARQSAMDFAKDRQGLIKVPRGYLTPVAYLWTRTVRCKNPACGATVPLVKQTWLCKKKDRFVAMRPVLAKEKKRVRFEIVESRTESGLGFDPEAFSKRGNATCPFCGTVSDSEYVKEEGRALRLGEQLMAVACSRRGRSGKVYISGDELSPSLWKGETVKKRIAALSKVTSINVPNEPIFNDAKNANFCVHYGLDSFDRLFNDRQTLCLLTFVSAVRAAERQFARIKYDSARAKVIATFLGVMVDKLADFSSTLCVWNYTGGRGVKNSFGRQAIPMTWDYSETNPFNEAGASWVAICEDTPAAIDLLSASGNFPAAVLRGSATAIPLKDYLFDAIITDPPYYDNVPYANISDFFYVWLKRSIGHLYLEHFATEGTPKKNEAVADAVRHGGNREKANRAYETTIAQAFREANLLLKKEGQMTVIYAHKTTMGWSTLVNALRQAGFTVTEAWPLDTEMKARLRGMDSAALATSIFLIAQKRDGTESGSYEEEVRPDLEQIVRERVETLWAMGITGADLIIAAVGAGLRAFTRFAHVEYANGEEVPAEKFLAEVEGVVLETLLEKIFGMARSGVSAVDPPSRFYVLWRYAYRVAELDAGEAIVFSMGQHVELDGPLGLSTGGRALIEKKKGRYRMRDFAERGQHEKLGLPNDVGEPAPLIDVLHRSLWLIEHEPRKLNSFLDEAHPNRERLRVVAQALAGAGLSGKTPEESVNLISTTTSEQAALAKLLANWRALVTESLFDAGGKNR
jgi:putative DNA methylase